MNKNPLPNLALITPYPQLGEIVAEQCTGIFNCHVYHGSLEKAASIARNLDTEYYDVILSRGGTAEYIEKSTQIPVVKILTSTADLLKSLIPLKNYPQHIAFFNYQTYLTDVLLIAQALNITIDEFVFLSHADMTEKLEQCRRRRYAT